MIIFEHGGLEKIKRIEKIRPNEVYMVGTNQAASTDSRHFGWIEKKQVIAKIVWQLKN